MPILEQFQAAMTGSPENRVEALRRLLGYPLKQLDPQGSRFWYLRPGEDEDEAEDTCPIAVGFYAELNTASDRDIKTFLTSEEQQREIYGHYTDRIVPDQPVMYLLLPQAERAGRVAMVLPSEMQLRQRQIQTFDWRAEDLQARLNRLKQETLARTNRMEEKTLAVVPLVEWAFYKPIETAKELAQELARVSRRIEQSVPAVYDAEGEEGYLHDLLRSFQRELLPTLKLRTSNEKDYSFADIYAQTIAYGLFTARVFSYTVDERKRVEEHNSARKETDFNRQNAWELLPETNPFLRRLFRDVSLRPREELGEDLIDILSEVVSILRAARMDVILEDFRAKMNREDIVIRFYEDFLAAYKPQMRERRGVYYTPEPVVSYMVRSVDILLKEKFNKPLGLADPEVMILDPACGTGTFLLWIFQLIYQRFQESPEALSEGLEDKSWSGYVKERLLPRVFGFELLMAPYAIAHLKLGLFLEETGYRFDTGKRLEVYLTNTLENTLRKAETLFGEFIAEEGDRATEIKQNLPIMVILGNPPYSPSIFEGEWIISLIQDYKEDLNETKSDLNREEWKFLKFAQDRISRTGHGIVAFVVNNTFIDAGTHRVMRKSVAASFQDILILDLHGSADKRERTPEGLPDKNVFDIKQGICIFMASKIRDVQQTSESSSRNFYEIYGSRDIKYKYLLDNNVKTTHWIKLSPEKTNHYFFCAKEFDLYDEYQSYLSILNVFKKSASGIQTKRDDFTTPHS